MLKANRVSTVHRHVQLDLVVVPCARQQPGYRPFVTAGLWTSAALATAPDRIPVLRTHLATLMERFGFDPSGHAGKAMTHVLTSLPHDLLVSLKLAELERVTLTAMSLTDRPRPKLLAIRSPLGRHLYIFVWLPRDDVSTGMRKQIENMLIEPRVARCLAGRSAWKMAVSPCCATRSICPIVIRRSMKPAGLDEARTHGARVGACGRGRSRPLDR